MLNNNQSSFADISYKKNDNSKIEENLGVNDFENQNESTGALGAMACIFGIFIVMYAISLVIN